MTIPPLTDAERNELLNWRDTYHWLPITGEIDFQLQLAVDGIEHTLLWGPPGVGKTYTVRHLLQRRNEAEEGDPCVERPGYTPRRIEYYETSDASGRRTALVDLYAVLIGKVGGRIRQSFTARELVEALAHEAATRNVRALCVDEAQMMSPANIDLLRQVPDVAERQGHAMGLVLIGTASLRTHVHATGQLGQRFSGEVQMRRWTAADLRAALTEMHPHLPAARAALSAREWQTLADDVFRSVAGSFRRLHRILANGNRLALHLNRRFDADVMRLAVSKLAPED